MKLKFREAIAADIKQIQHVRHAVKENILSDPSKVTDEDCRVMIEERGRGWVCELQGQIVGFSIVDLIERNVWALFILPDSEKKGIGRKLHNLMLDWTYGKGVQSLWLSTDPNTRADGFYKKMGWQDAGLLASGERKFEIDLSKGSTK